VVAQLGREVASTQTTAYHCLGQHEDEVAGKVSPARLRGLLV
jgi:hypothetical protein